MVKTGRNAPCPCGSGKKAKRCCGERASRLPPSPGAPLHMLDEQLVEEMLAFANLRFGRNWFTKAQEEYFLKDEGRVGMEQLQLFIPWVLHHWGIEAGRPVREWFLEEQGNRLSKVQRAWLTAQASSVVTLWEVQAVSRGEGVTVTDRLGGETRFVHDVKISQAMGVRTTMLGRVVEQGGISVLCGLHPSVLPPHAAAEAEREARVMLETPDGEVPREKLKGEAETLELIHLWMEAVLELEPLALGTRKLTNTDGDPLLMTVDHFTFPPWERERVLERLLGLKGAELTEEEMPALVVFLKKGNAMHKSWRNTVVGRAWVSEAHLLLETNSVRRAETLRKRVEAACTGLLTYQTRQHSDPETLLEALGAAEAPAGGWR